MHSIDLNKRMDLTQINWAIGISGSSTGILPKSNIVKNNIKYFIKLSSYSEPFGFYGKEALIEFINSRIGQLLGLNVLEYTLSPAIVILDNKRHITLASISKDFTQGKYNSISIEKMYRTFKKEGEYPLDIVSRLGLLDEIYKQFVFDFVICNMDRHSKNNEVITTKQGYSLAPYFDNSLTFILNRTESDIRDKKRYNDETRVNNYIGDMNLLANLYRINRPIVIRTPRKEDRKQLFQGLAAVTTRQYRDYIWDMLNWRVADVKKQRIQAIQWR